MAAMVRARTCSAASSWRFVPCCANGRSTMSKRTHRAEIARETLSILQAGFYHAPSGQLVRIADELEFARSQTRAYAPDDPIDGTASAPCATRIDVTGESTLEAARCLDAASPGSDPCCLNFASAKNPGGGFL